MMRIIILVLLLCRQACQGDDEYEFWKACEEGDVSAMSSILDASNDIDLEYPDDNGVTPLVLSMSQPGQAEATRWLLKRGASPEACGRWPGSEESPLSIAASRGQLDALDTLLEFGAMVNAGSGRLGSTPLMAAAAAGQREAVEVLLSIGAEVNAQRKDGTTALSWAAQGGHLDSVQLLLDHGADPDIADELDGSTPVHFAARAVNDHEGACLRELLKASKVSPSYTVRTRVMAPKKSDEAGNPLRPGREELQGGLTPLMAAAASAALGPARVLIEVARENEIDPEEFVKYINAVDVAGLTALAWACTIPNRVGTTQILNLLAEFGARDDSVSIDGRALLHVAAHGGNARAIAWLVDVRSHPVDLPTMTSQQHTPLLFAAFRGSRTSVKALVRRGAILDRQAPTDGATALIAAASAGHKPLVTLLLKLGANPLLQLSTGEFPSQVTPKTPHGKRLKWALSKAERKAWQRLDAFFRTKDQQAPPEQEDGVDDALVEDLDDEMDGSFDDEDEEDFDNEDKPGGFSEEL